MAIQAPKGTKDMLPQEAYKWHFVENKLRFIANTYGLREIRTPIFENTELFIRGVGDTTDVVQKEMYTFDDKGGRSITLKAEGTAPAVRAFIEKSLYAETQPTKLYYFTPVFRYENVQHGRLRQHHQFGIEVFGSQEPSLDAEVISLAMRAFEEFGIKGLSLRINSIGCPECRKKYNNTLMNFLKENYDNLCTTCKSRYEKNPMRILDCKEKKCKEITKDAPVIIDYICDDCKNHFESLQQYLKAINIDFQIDPYIVRGLDYYTKTVFEIVNKDLTVCGGGRYDGLIKSIGGPEMPAVGFGMGVERLIMTLENEGIEIPVPVYMDIFIGGIGEGGKQSAFALTNILRKQGIAAECDHMGRSVKAQMKYANKMGARFTIILGEDEVKNNKGSLKRMNDGEIFEIGLDDLNTFIDIIKG